MAKLKRKGRKSRAGRKRLVDVARTPSGRSKGSDDYGPTERALYQRAQLLPGVSDPTMLASAAAGQTLGRLELGLRITERQRIAGTAYLDLALVYRRMTLEPPQPAAVDPSRPKGRLNGDDWVTWKRTAGEYREAFRLFGKVGGPKVVMAMWHLLYDRVDDLPALKAGLDVLIFHHKTIRDAGQANVDRYRAWLERRTDRKTLTGALQRV
jgi:hypothetical protein